MEIILASASPRRKELLALITADFSIMPADVDESVLTENNPQTPAQTAQWLAGIKAEALAGRRPDAAIIGCDTVVEINGKILGKPANEKEAGEMLHALSGNKHLVHTGLCLIYPDEAGARQKREFVETTGVYFAPVPLVDIAAYVKTAEPYDKAGGYGIQGWAAKYIPRIEGCYYNVMGLPVAFLMQKMKENGLIP